MSSLTAFINADAYPPEVIAATTFVVGAVTTLGGRSIYKRFFRRIQNTDWVTPGMVANKRWVKGVVTSVGDADNFRLYHTPAFGWRGPLRFRRVPTTSKELKDQTIHIRIAGVDAPEASHFGREAQPYSAEALAWLRQKILGKRVHCQLLRRDQYGRTVAYVALPQRLIPSTRLSKKRNLALEMLRAGWATTYQQYGAEHGSIGKAEFLRIEAEAKIARVGQWKSGIKGESPAEYKRRQAASEAMVKGARSFFTRASTT
ncbi:nuclease [Cylindrobasidium torrendii FP15055 ss-10]|uniref:Nuclease n=1 Tax=Cylindrobasidium torrendii FP15055 ss-10 TaxID=1314674 RepID=A0A0D7BUB8_9AGAR|nr:nuclease [Cylindrobasidium torrendii FP15055 ss-10]